MLTQRLVRLRHDCERLTKLVRIAKPVQLPALNKGGAGGEGGGRLEGMGREHTEGSGVGESRMTYVNM